MNAQDIVAQIKAQSRAARVAANAAMGQKRIIAITTNGGSREDGNVYYTWHILVESDALKFNEPIFNDPSEGTLVELGLIDPDNESAADAMPKIADHMRSLGYVVHDFPTQIITIGDDK